MNKLNKLKTVIIMITAMLTVMLSSSCKKDDDGSGEPSIVGTWLQTSGVNETFRDNVSEGRTNETINSDNFTRVTFNEDGNFDSFYSDYYNGEVETWTDKGSYVIDGNKLTVTVEGGEEDEVVTMEFTVTDTELTTVYKDEYTFGGAEIRYIETIVYARQ